jgi:outer membrane beta-barrel protein
MKRHSRTEDGLRAPNGGGYVVRFAVNTGSFALLIALLLCVAPSLANAQSAAASDSSAAPAAPASDAPSGSAMPTASAAPAPTVADADSDAKPVIANARLLVGSRKVRLTHSERNVVRTGPGDHYSIVGVYPEGAVFPVIAKSGEWYNIRLSDAETGWIHSSLCKEYDDLSNLEFKPNPKLYSRTGAFILTGYAGAYSFDRMSNSLVLGGRLGYYVFDMLQIEGGLSWTHVHRPAEIVESLFNLQLEAQDFGMLFYDLTTTLEVLPGRQMVPFVSAGVGSSIFLGKAEPAFNIGAGTSLYLSRTHAVRWEVRDYMFHSGPDDARVSNNNIQFSLGTAILF